MEEEGQPTPRRRIRGRGGGTTSPGDDDQDLRREKHVARRSDPYISVYISHRVWTPIGAPGKCGLRTLSYTMYYSVYTMPYYTICILYLHHTSLHCTALHYNVWGYLCIHKYAYTHPFFEATSTSVEATCSKSAATRRPCSWIASERPTWSATIGTWGTGMLLSRCTCRNTNRT